MYCPQCGTANDDAASFCNSCGKDLQQYREQWSASPAGTPEAGTGQPPDGSQPAPPPSATPPPYQQQYQSPYQTTPAYQPAAYQPAGHQPGYGYGTIPNIPSYMGWAIVTLILCFWPTGIVAVVYASKVGNQLALGNIPGAQEASRKAKMWTWITFAIGIAIAVIAIAAAVIFAVAVNSVRVY